MADSKSEEKTPNIKGIYKILPYLYLGNGDVASEKEELQRLGIKVILNCQSDDVDNFFENDGIFEYHSFHAEDAHDTNIAQFFDRAYEILSKVKEDKSIILVHDGTGKNVAPTIILSYMLKSSKNQDKHLPLAAAIKFVQGKAISAQPIDEFLAQLVDLEVELYDDASVQVKGRNKYGGTKGARGGKSKRK
jgi:hypothetical protein